MLETNLDLILEAEKLGKYHQFTLEISFPEKYTSDMFQKRIFDEFTNINMSYVCTVLYDRKNDYDLKQVVRFQGDDWSSQLECQIASVYTSLIPLEDCDLFLKPIPRKHMTYAGGQDSFHYEFGYLMGEALMNSVWHGNNMDPRKKAYIHSYLGREGLIFAIEDQGEGFDVQTVADLANNKKYQTAERSGGYGTAQFREGFMNMNGLKPKKCKPPRIGYNTKGNVWMMIYSFQKCRYRPLAFQDIPTDFGAVVLPTNLEFCPDKIKRKYKLY